MGEPWRIKYGAALGPLGTYAANSALTLLTPGDTTPDVTDGTLFYTNNTSATTITYFDTLGPGGQPGTGFNQGKVITIFFRDSITTIQNGGQIFLNPTQASGAIPANTVMDLVYHNSAWYERSRSANAQGAAASAFKSVSYTFSGTIGGAMLNVTTADRIYITVSAVGNITGFAGGVSGQTVDMVVIGVGTNVFVTQSAGVLQLPGTGTALLSNSGTYRFHTYDGVEWRIQGGAFA